MAKFPTIGEQRTMFPQVAIQIVGGSIVIDIVESPIKITRVILENKTMSQLFVSYGSSCLESVIRDMLKARALNLGKLGKEPAIATDD